MALACALRLHGIPIRIIDQASGPSTTSRANILHARGVEVLDRLGGLADLPDRAQTALTITQYLDGEPAITIRFGDLGLGEARPALYVSQAEIEAGLRQRLQELGAEVEWGTALEALSQDDDQVVATIVDSRTVSCAWLVGCDGAHSTVRRLAGISFPGVPITERFLLADVHADWPIPRSGGHGWPHDNGPFFAMPMHDKSGRDDLWRLMAYDAESEGEMTDELIVERLGHLARERTGRSDMRIKDAVWTSVFRAHRRLAESYQSGRTFLAGDAAHIHSPLGGQGMVTGIGDAENLGWKLALVIAETANASLLATYEAERRPIATEVLRSTTGATRLQVGKTPVMRFLRNRILVPVANLRSVQRRASQIASQLWVTYRNGPLAMGRRPWFGSGPHPGDRVADLACTRADGSIARLHGELGRRWAILAPRSGADDYVAEARQRLGMEVSTLTRDGQSDFWLIRPDSHLAWRGRSPGDLGRWLDRVLSG